ncbi:uncharacterized protein MJAP1_003205 [Malassezia japonica]|uniref:Uncharacterized protein n=1 Tax=Malassezia japonica TaxID=223818 RepID=A0AAF0F5F8_9BASI|nr:uncharacterized protein MJAP1_003205 [Malassezia japonica]WFD40219.1 hypothetical protein MJAP1_003205 [Malassezia japonica]
MPDTNSGSNHSALSYNSKDNDTKARSEDSASPPSEGSATGKHDSRDASHGRGNSNKFRCRVAMACRKCEYERVSEHDNLLSRERKRLSRERKAARIAATTLSHSNTNNSNNSDSSGEEKSGNSGMPQVHIPFDHKAQSPSFSIPVSTMSVTTQTSPTDIPTSMIASAPAPDATISPAWATAQGNPTKEMMPWIMPASMGTSEGTLNSSASMSPQQDSLVSLRSTADPSLLELSAPPSALSTDSPSLMSMPWMDTKRSMSPSDAGFSSAHLNDFGQSLSALSATSLESESTVVDPLELNTAMDTPLKLFSDTQLPSTMATTPSSVDTNTVSDTGSSAFGPMSMNMSPLSPQLAPASFDGFEANMEQRPFSGLDGPDDPLYSSSLPAHDSHLGFGGDLEPSSLPVLSSWTQLAPSNA